MLDWADHVSSLFQGEKRKPANMPDSSNLHILYFKSSEVQLVFPV